MYLHIGPKLSLFPFLSLYPCLWYTIVFAGKMFLEHKRVRPEPNKTTSIPSRNLASSGDSELMKYSIPPDAAYLLLGSNEGEGKPQTLQKAGNGNMDLTPKDVRQHCTSLYKRIAPKTPKCRGCVADCPAFSLYSVFLRLHLYATPGQFEPPS